MIPSGQEISFGSYDIISKLPRTEEASKQRDPTDITYRELGGFFFAFNYTLFKGRLPPCLITLQRHRHAYGYFAGQRFAQRDGSEVTDEIALNPATFAKRSTIEILSTLVHEMVHLEQHHFGHPSGGSYHNLEFARLMDRVGLVTSQTGEPGGRRTGAPVSHYILQGGPFERVALALLAHGIDVSYVEALARLSEPSEPMRLRAKQKAASKTRFDCINCNARAWGKPTLQINCRLCELAMLPHT